MQVNSINTFNYVNKANQMGLKKQDLKQNNISAQEVNFTGEDKKHKAMGPLLAVMMIPMATIPTSCIDVSASARAYAVHQNGGVPVTPVENDTIRDTIYVPMTYEFPQEIHDSLNYWRGGILDLPAEGDDNSGDYSNKVLLSAGAIREWDFQRPEYLKANLEKSREDEAFYDHIIRGNEISPDSVVNDVRVTLVKPNQITVKRLDGSESSNVTGLMFNEDGVKVFMHSNGRDKLHVYKKETDRSSENYGKFVELGTAERGDLDVSEDGLNVKLVNLLGDNTIDYFTHGAFTVISKDELDEITKRVHDAYFDAE